MILNISVTAVVAVILGVVLGELLFRRRGRHEATRGYAAFATLVAIMWMTTGLFLVLGGFEVIGVIVLAVFFFFARGNYARATGGKGLRQRIAGAR